MFARFGEPAIVCDRMLNGHIAAEGRLTAVVEYQSFRKGMRSGLTVSHAIAAHKGVQTHLPYFVPLG